MKWQVINGNNIDVLKTYEDNTFDSIITDPPYGIEFLGKDWDKNTGVMETWQECFRVLKPGGHILAFSAARTYHHLATNIEMAGFEIRDQLMWLYASGFPKAQDIGKAIQKRQGVKETKTHNKLNAYTKNNDIPKYSGKIRVGNVTKDDYETEYEETIPTSPEAKQWSGWKTALKPAHEPIVMARKPFKGSTIDNVLEWGTGAMNIDATRIPSEKRIIITPKNGTYQCVENSHSSTINKAENMEKVEYGDRFPSNVLGEIPEYQKYFYCPKVSRAERHAGFEKMPEPYDRRTEGLESAGIQGLQKLNGQKHKDPLAHIPTMPTTNGNIVGNGQSKLIEREEIQSMGNNHPTVKPVELMKYLIKLVTPKGGTVLDPFNGSGSTGMAAVELGYDYVGCELDPDYVEIANRRISAWEKRFDTPAYKLFD